MAGRFVKKAVTAKELLEGTEIEIDPMVTDSEESEEEEDEEFQDELSNNFKNEMSKIASNNDLEIEISNLSLVDLKDQMEPLTEDKLVLKLVVKAGVGPVLPEGCIFFMHYNACVEDNTEPFDSTYLRKKPERFWFKQSGLLPGLDTCAKTMRQGEIAKVWIHSSYAYGEHGVPPRIPPNANLLYNLEIVKYIDSKAAIEFEDMTPEEQKHAPFDVIFKVCATEHASGNDFFGNQRYYQAAGRYIRAVRLLEKASAPGAEEDEKRSCRLLKLYLNLSSCYLKLKNPKKTILYSRKALDLEPNNVKALYRLGNGYLLESDFDFAKKYLLRAKQQKPHDKDINESLLKLEGQARKFSSWDRAFCQRMFKANPMASKEIDLNSLESPEFIKTIEDRLQELLNSEDSDYTLPSTFTVDQIEVVKKIAESKDLYFIEKVYKKEKVIKILKKNH